MNRMAFYTACKADRKPIHNQYDHKVICGSVEYDSSLKQNLKDEGFILDEEGVNISSDNWTFADVANVFYVWKNANEEFVGVNQYKRWWTGLDTVSLRDDTLYVPEKIILPRSILSHVKTNRETIPERGIATDTYIKLSKEGRFPLDMTSALSSNLYVAHNMFFGHRDIFNRTSLILFEYLWPIYESCKLKLPRHDPYHARQMGFVSELVIDGIVKNINHFFGDEINVEHVRMD